MGDWDIELDRSIADDGDWRNEVYRYACHEAAHAVVGERLGNRVKLIRLTDDGESSETGVVGDVDFEEKKVTLRSAGCYLVMTLAGPAFERLLRKGKMHRTPRFKGKFTDMDEARKVAHFMSRGTPPRVLIDRHLELARQMVVENWPLILAIGKRLAYEGELTGRQIRNMMAKAA
jgi:hypothetical protein